MGGRGGRVKPCEGAKRSKRKGDVRPKGREEEGQAAARRHSSEQEPVPCFLVKKKLIASDCRIYTSKCLSEARYLIQHQKFSHYFWSEIKNMRMFVFFKVIIKGFL
jgi:hypothetical protein